MFFLSIDFFWTRYDVAHVVNNAPYFLVNNSIGSPLTIHAWAHFAVGSVNGMWVNLLSLPPRTCTCPCPRRTRTPWGSLCRTQGPWVSRVPGCGPTFLLLCAPNRTADRRCLLLLFWHYDNKNNKKQPGLRCHWLLENAHQWTLLFSFLFVPVFFFCSKNLYIQLCCRSCFYIHTFQ